MYFFVNDYNSICYPEILDCLKENMDEFNIGYGFDYHSDKAKALIRKALALSLIHISEPTRREWLSRMPSSA